MNLANIFSLGLGFGVSTAFFYFIWLLVFKPMVLEGFKVRFLRISPNLDVADFDEIYFSVKGNVLKIRTQVLEFEALNHETDKGNKLKHDKVKACFGYHTIECMKFIRYHTKRCIRRAIKWLNRKILKKKLKRN